MDRLELQTKFEEILGVKHVYFQPPESVKIKFPAIIYSLNGIDPTFANDSKYKKYKNYSVMLVDQNPESKYVDDILDLEYCSFDRVVVSDNLYHYHFTIHI